MGGRELEKADDLPSGCRNWKAFEPFICSSGAPGSQLQIVSCMKSPLCLLNCRCNAEPGRTGCILGRDNSFFSEDGSEGGWCWYCT